MKRIVTAVVVVTLAAGVANLNAQAGQGAKQKSLFDRLGGTRATIVKVVDDFVANVAADKRIVSFFKAAAGDPARMARFKGNLVDQICEASGGPCKYTGKDMKTAHAGMGISTADFNALVEDLVKTLNTFKVAKADQDQLLGVLGPMKAMIVEKK